VVRVVVRSWGNGGTPTLSGSKAHPQAWSPGMGMMQEKERPRCSRWVSDVVVAGLTKMAAPGRHTRRCSTSCAAPASRSTWTFPSPRGDRSGSTRSRTAPSSGTSVATWRTTPPSRLHSPSPLRWHTQEEGKKPKWVGEARLGS
jgi:hypothetical protein